MRTIEKSALVPYSAEQMFTLVEDVESYPQFLDWCGNARVQQRDEAAVTASIQIAYKGVHKEFTTRNLLVPGREMTMQLVDGPFRHLQGLWCFTPLDEQACKVSLKLDFEFSNALVKLALGPVFESIANRLVDQFQQRARQLYGPGESA